MSDISQLENKLFRDWTRLHSGRFVKDGVLNPSKFSIDGSLKILFIMKEAVNKKNSAGELETNFDLREWFKTRSSGRTWSTLADWAYGLTSDLKSWDQLEKERHSTKWSTDIERRAEWLSRVAVININKHGGKSTSPAKRIREKAHEFRDLLIEQINLIEPNIVIACGTSDVIKKILFPEVNPYWKQTNKTEVWHTFHPEKKWKLIGFYHPGYWAKSDQEKYELLLDTVKEIIN